MRIVDGRDAGGMHPVVRSDAHFPPLMAAGNSATLDARACFPRIYDWRGCVPRMQVLRRSYTARVKVSGGAEQ